MTRLYIIFCLFIPFIVFSADIDKKINPVSAQKISGEVDVKKNNGNKEKNITPYDDVENKKTAAPSKNASDLLSKIKSKQAALSEKIQAVNSESLEKKILQARAFTKEELDRLPEKWEKNIDDNLIKITKKAAELNIDVFVPASQKKLLKNEVRDDSFLITKALADYLELPDNTFISCPGLHAISETDHTDGYSILYSIPIDTLKVLKK